MGIFDRLFARKNKSSKEELSKQKNFAATNVLMDEETFWEIINKSKLKSQGDYEVQQVELANELRKLTPKEILTFSNRFQFFKDQAYSWELWGAIYIIQGGCGDDSFNDFREWVIGQGKDFYYRTIQDPETLVSVDEDEILIEWEGLGYVPSTVFEELTGHEMPFNQEENASSNNEEPTGQSWDEDDLKKRHPKLYAKYPDNV